MHQIQTVLILILVAGMLAVGCSQSAEAPAEAMRYKCSSQSIECNKSQSGIMARPALPDSTVTNLSEKLEYILETDHEDRMNGTVLFDMSRDSLRLTQVLEWYEAGLIKSWEDKYKAAFIFIHKGGPLMAENQEYLKIAHEMFAEVARETSDPAIRAESIELSTSALESYLNWMLWEEVAMRMARQQVSTPAGA